MKRIWIVCSLLIFLIIGCRSDSDQSDILSIPKFRISFPEEGKSQISRILIFIEGHNRKLLPQEFLVKEDMMEVGLMLKFLIAAHFVLRRLILIDQTEHG